MNEQNDDVKLDMDGNPVDTPTGRRGHVCCGFCCDTRRAVFVVDIVSIVLTLLGTILFLAGAEAIQGTAVQSDDETVNDATVAFQNAHRGPIVVVLLVSVVCYAAGVYGALQFAPPFVWTAAICHVVAFIGNLASLNVIGVILEACFVYPHAVFIREMRAGVMTPDNYVNEVHSCCCV